MPISVRLLKEDLVWVVAELEGSYVPDARIIAQPLAYPLLYGIDPYANTIFNGRQMKVLAIEVTKLADEVSDDRRPYLVDLALMCQRGWSRPHHYLKFVGD